MDRTDLLGAKLVQWQRWLFGKALRLTNGNVHDAEDLVQELASRALEKAEQLREPAKAGVWLLRILRSIGVEWARKNGRTLDPKAFEQIEDERAQTPDVHADEAQEAEQHPRADLKEALADLRARAPALANFVEVSLAAGDIEAACEQLGYKNTHRWRRELQRLAAWFQKNGGRHTLAGLVMFVFLSGARSRAEAALSCDVGILRPRAGDDRTKGRTSDRPGTGTPKESQRALGEKPQQKRCRRQWPAVTVFSATGNVELPYAMELLERTGPSSFVAKYVYLVRNPHNEPWTSLIFLSPWSLFEADFSYHVGCCAPDGHAVLPKLLDTTDQIRTIMQQSTLYRIVEMGRSTSKLLAHRKALADALPNVEETRTNRVLEAGDWSRRDMLKSLVMAICTTPFVAHASHRQQATPNVRFEGTWLPKERLDWMFPADYGEKGSSTVSGWLAALDTPLRPGESRWFSCSVILDAEQALQAPSDPVSIRWRAPLYNYEHIVRP